MHCWYDPSIPYADSCWYTIDGVQTVVTVASKERSSFADQEASGEYKYLGVGVFDSATRFFEPVNDRAVFRLRELELLHEMPAGVDMDRLRRVRDLIDRVPFGIQLRYRIISDYDRAAQDGCDHRD